MSRSIFVSDARIFVVYAERRRSEEGKSSYLEMSDAVSFSNSLLCEGAVRNMHFDLDRVRRFLFR